MMSRSTGGGGPPTPAFVRAYASFHSGRAGKKRFYNSDSADILDLRSVLGAPDSLTRASRSPLATPNGTVFRTSGRVDQASKIADFLFLGSVNDAQDPVQLARNHIRYIINVSNEEYWTVDKNVVVYPFRIDDTMNANITPLFKATRTIIERVRREHYEAKVAGSDSPPCVLVHCQKGISRSPTIVMAYLIYRNGWSLSEAMQHVTRRRPIVEPNLGFMDALKQFQESIEPAERSRRYAQLSVVLKNVSTRCPVATIREFFESKVGMVRDVTMHTRPQSGPSAQAAVAAAQAAALAQQQKDGRTGEPLALIKAPPEETSLCMVFFVCAESVPTAKEYAASHCKEMEVMAEASTGKEVRLIVPSNIKAVTRPSRRKKKPSGASPNGSPPRRASRSPNRTPRQYSVGDSNEQAELSRTQSRDSDASPYWPV